MTERRRCTTCHCSYHDDSDVSGYLMTCPDCRGVSDWRYDEQGKASRTDATGRKE